MNKSPQIMILSLLLGLCVLPHFSPQSSTTLPCPTPRSAGPTDPPAQLWNDSWGGSAFDEMIDIWGDDNYLFGVGDAQSWGVGSYDVLVTKWTKNGTLVKNVTYGTTQWERARGIWGSKSGIVLCCDYLDTNHGDNYDILLLKYDLDLNLVWSREWGSKLREYPWGIWSDGLAYYVCGYNNQSGDYDELLIKFDFDGNEVWHATWGGSCSEEAQAVWGDATGMYTCGRTCSFGAGNWDLVCVKWDYNGHVLWNRTWGTTVQDDGYDVWSNGTRVYCAGTMSSGSNPDMELVAWDAAGILLWNKTWVRAGSDLARAMWVSDDAIYEASSSDFGNTQMLVVKWDREGNYLWNVSWGGSSSDPVWGMWGDVTGLYFAGTTYSTGSGDAVMVKWDESAPMAADGIYIATESPCGLWCILLIVAAIIIVSVLTVYELYQHFRGTRNKAKTTDQEGVKDGLDFG